MPIQTMAHRCSVQRVRQCESSHLRPKLARIGIGKRGLDEVFKYLSRHRLNHMTGYGKCCGRLIVAQNWLHCPFCGGDLLGGQPVSLRTRIADAEQTGMDDYLGVLEGAPDVPSRPETCIFVSVRGAHSGQNCIKPFSHKGKHKYAATAALFDF